ncbi:hypothetical protein AAC387_Pa03g1635 [Persea americana]
MYFYSIMPPRKAPPTHNALGSNSHETDPVNPPTAARFQELRQAMLEQQRQANESQATLRGKPMRIKLDSKNKWLRKMMKWLKYAPELVDIVQKKVTKFLEGLNPIIERDATGVVPPATFDEVVKRAYKFENINNKIIQETKQFNQQNQRQQQSKKPREDRNPPRQGTSGHCGKNHETSQCRKATGACFRCQVVLLANLIVLDMYDFDIILGMDWLEAYHAMMDCFAKTITFRLKGAQVELMIQGDKKKTQAGFILALKASRLVQGGCEVYIAFSTEYKHSQGVEDILVVCEFLYVFPEEILGLPPIREVEFIIELLSGTTPISIAPYRMAPAELGELKLQLQELLSKGFIRPSVSPWGAPEDHEEYMRTSLQLLRDNAMLLSSGPLSYLHLVGCVATGERLRGQGLLPFHAGAVAIAEERPEEALEPPPAREWQPDDVL